MLLVGGWVLEFEQESILEIPSEISGVPVTLAFTL